MQTSPEFYEATRIIFVCKKKKKDDFIQQFFSSMCVHFSARKQGAAHACSQHYLTTNLYIFYEVVNSYDLTLTIL